MGVWGAFFQSVNRCGSLGPWQLFQLLVFFKNFLVFVVDIFLPARQVSQSDTLFFGLYWITTSYFTPILVPNLLIRTWPSYFSLRQHRQTLTLTSTCYFDFIEVNWNQDGLKGKPGSRILKTIVAISNFGNRITSTQTFLLSASSEKTKTITTTLRLLFYVEILWPQHRAPQSQTQKCCN